MRGVFLIGVTFAAVAVFAQDVVQVAPTFTLTGSHYRNNSA